MVKAAAVIFLICFWFANSGAAQIESIGIASKWSGLGRRQESVVVVSKKDGKYFAADGREVPGEFLTALERAIDAPEIMALNLDNLGITQTWLDANAESAFSECRTYSGIRATTKQKLLFNRIFRDKTRMEIIVRDYLMRGAHTDDYPRVEVTIKSAAGTIKLSSSQQAPLMLPWKIESRGKKSVAYNADISRAVVKLMPAKFTNRDRLSGERFRPNVSFKVMNEVFGEQRKTVKKRN